MELSEYQKGILEWVLHGTGNAACNAVAGSGKSTTLKLAAQALHQSGVNLGNIRIIVFGKANAKDLLDKFGKEWEQSISTLHSAGWKLIKTYLEINNPRGLINSSKYRKIAQYSDFIGSRQNPKGNLRRNEAIGKDSSFLKLIDLVRLTGTEASPEIVQDIVKHYQIEEIYQPDEVAEALKYVISTGEAQAKNGESFDFTDQIWLPAKWQLFNQVWFKPYKFVLVDECQDLNASQLELSLGLAGTNGRLLYVGDPRQAIMGFAGADNRSYQKIVDRVKAKELPLSICYRCPKSHISLVNSVFPEIPIQPSPTAKEGEVKQITEKEIHEFLEKRDLVVCRKTAPLVSLCIQLIGRGIPATVKGKAIGDQLKDELEEIAKLPRFQYSDFNEFLNQYEQLKLTRLNGHDDEEQLKGQLNDKLSAIRAIYQSQPNSQSIEDLGRYIDSLFSSDDEYNSPIMLSTVHRAKGLEAERVFIFEAEKMPLSWKSQLRWQLEQEENLLYVALTRSKNQLFLVGDKPDWLPGDERATTTEQETVTTVSTEWWVCPHCSHKNIAVGFPGDYECTSCGVDLSDAEDEALSNVEIADASAMAKALLITDPTKSDRAIAELAGCSAPTVGKARRKLEEEGLIEKVFTRVGKDGRLQQAEHARSSNDRMDTLNKFLELADKLQSEEVQELIVILQQRLTKINRQNENHNSGSLGELITCP